MRKKKKLSVKTIFGIEGDVRDVANKIIKHIQNNNTDCVIFGGESTVKINKEGNGGRNQELVLILANELHNKKYIIASIGTDGIDGNTKYAGAIIDTNSGYDNNVICRYLKGHNSGLFFNKYGGNILTGPTHTNVNDIGIILKYT